MTAFFADGLELDRCPQCEGLWLDVNEVERLHGLKDFTFSQVDAPTTCPRGHGTLSRGAVANLTADICSKCRGAFIPETQPEVAAAAVTRAVGVAAVKRGPVTAICDGCGKKVAASEGSMGKGGFQCSTCRSGKVAPDGDRVFNLIGHVLDSIKGG